MFMLIAEEIKSLHYAEHFFEFDHQLPIGLLQIITEIVFTGIDRSSTYLLNEQTNYWLSRMIKSNKRLRKKSEKSCLAHKYVSFFKMPSDHFGRFSRYWLNLDANFFTFTSGLYVFVVALDTSNYSNVQKLK